MLTKSSDTLQYLIDAVSGSAKINIPAITAGYFPKDNTQTAVYFKGKASVVFAFQLQKKLKAIKIWPAPVGEHLRDHYRIIENYIQRGELNYFGGICYLKDAITIKDQPHDALLMDWIGRQNIKEYIIANIDQKELLDALAEKVYCLHQDLNNAGIAHGHLHTGNIYIDANNELKLIDYDSLYVKGITEEQEILQNFPDYSHPSFSTQQKINTRSDYFSALLLYLGIKAIAYNTILWGRYKVGFQENFLFSAADFLDLKNSSVYKYLRKTGSPEIDELLEILVMYCEEKDPDNLQPFYTYLKNDAQPVIKSVPAIENTRESNNPAEGIKLVNPAPLVHVTMPAQVVIDEPVKTQAIVEEWPVEEHNSSGNTIEAAAIYENLPKEPLLIFNNNNQNLEEVKNIPEQIVNLPADNSAKKITAPGKRPGKKNTTKPGVSKKHKTVFVIGLCFIAAAAFTAIYFLGNYTNNNGEAITPSLVKTATQQADEPIKKAASETIHDSSTNISTVDSAAANTFPAAASAGTIAENDSVTTEPATTKINSVAKATITDAESKPADTSAITPGKKSLVNDISEQHLTNAAHKPAVVKNNSIKKQSSNAFEIGTVPKQ